MSQQNVKSVLDEIETSIDAVSDTYLTEEYDVKILIHRDLSLPEMEESVVIQALGNIDDRIGTVEFDVQQEPDNDWDFPTQYKRISSVVGRGFADYCISTLDGEEQKESYTVDGADVSDDVESALLFGQFLGQSTIPLEVFESEYDGPDIASDTQTMFEKISENQQMIFSERGLLDGNEIAEINRGDTNIAPLLLLCIGLGVTATYQQNTFLTNKRRALLSEIHDITEGAAVGPDNTVNVFLEERPEVEQLSRIRKFITMVEGDENLIVSSDDETEP